MDKQNGLMKTSTRLFLTIGSIVALSGIFIVAFVNNHERKHALHTAEAKARIILNRNLATHTYFTHQLKPKLFKSTDGINSDDYFEPTWMSSTYAVREIDKYFESLEPNEYYYKECAVNARSPLNEADAYETSFIEELNTNSELTARSVERVLDNKSYFVILQRGEVMEENCLRCHSTPEKAPEDLVRLYGSERSFNRKKGDVVSAISIRIPLSLAYNKANRHSLQLSTIMMTVLGVLFGAVYSLNRRFIFKPLSKIQKKAFQISNNDEHLGEEISLSKGRELNKLTSVFNKMSIKLRYQLDHLEERIQDRTAKLEKFNKQLQNEVKERRQAEAELEKHQDHLEKIVDQRTALLQKEITDRKIAQALLEENETRYRTLFETMTDGVAIYEAKNNGDDFIFKELNRAGEEISAVSKDSVVGQSVLKMFPDIVDLGLFDVFRRVWNTGKSEHHPVSHYQDGRVSQWVENSVYKLPSGEVVAIYSDETKRKRSEDELRLSEEKYRLILASMKDCAYITSKEFRIEYMNPKMVSRIGRDAVGEICHKVIYDSDEICSWCVFDKIHAGKHVDYELKNPIDNRYYFITNTPITSVEEFISKLTIVRDITESKAIEAQLQQARKMESIGILAGGVAHDFNNLLFAIIGRVELVLDDIPKCNPVHADLTEIMTACLKAADIVRQLLNFSRKTALEFKSIAVSTIVNDALKLLKTTIPATIEIRTPLPDANVLILADATQITQILMNICINAFQAMEGGVGILDINVENLILSKDAADYYPDLPVGEYVKITVNDTGPGIDSEIIDKIFNPYFTTKDFGNGSGMGLAVVHGIVKKHHGAITVGSEPGKGTTFTLLFPVVAEKPVLKIKTTGEIPRGNETILFVDDDESIANMIQDMLEGLGYKVETQTNPLKTLEQFQLKSNQFDLVITDMTMPQMTGATLLEELKAVCSDIPVIICTGHSPIMDEEKAKSLGFSAFLMKPFSRRDIAKTIRKVLDNSES